MGLGEKKNLFRLLTQNWPFLDLPGRPGDKNFFKSFFHGGRLKTTSLEKKLIFLIKNYKITDFLQNSQNLLFWAIFEVRAHSKMGFNHTKFIKICRNTNFDMGFQKKTPRDLNSKVDFFFGRVSRELLLKG